MSYASVELLGRQQPRILVSPPRVSSAGQEAAELAESAGLVLDPWQRLALEEALGERADGSWAAYEVGLEVPRQNGKGSWIEARELAGLFLFGDRLIVHSAHLFKTAKEAFKRILQLIEGSSDLAREVRRVTWTHGSEGIELMSGQRLEFVARGRGSGRGLTGDVVVLDEAYNLSTDMMADLLPTLSARPNPQIIYTSSAGFGIDRSESDVLWALRRRALLGIDTERLCWMEWSAHEDSATDSLDALADANPGLGQRLTVEFSATERGAMTEEAYRRERLGIWAPSRKLDDEQGESLRDLWAQCELAVSTVGKRRAFGVGVAPESTSAALWVAGESSAGGWHLEIIDHGPDVQAIGARAKALAVKHKAKVGFDPSGPAGVLVPVLGDVGLKVSGAQLAAACADLVAGVKAKTIRQRVPSKLATAVAASMAGAVKDPKPGDGGWVWSCKSSAVDITPTTGATVALWAAKASPARKSTRSY